MAGIEVGLGSFANAQESYQRVIEIAQETGNVGLLVLPSTIMDSYCSRPIDLLKLSQCFDNR